MKYRRMPIEVESPEQLGYDRIRYNLTESSVRDRSLAGLGIEEFMEWVEPSGGVVCFPRIRPEAPCDIDEFYRVLNAVHGTYVGPGHWFEQSRRHMRVGCAWPLPDELEAGLTAISGSIRAALTI